MGKFFHNNGLSICLLALFLLFWLGQTIAGYAEYSDDREKHGLPRITLQEYVRTPHFLEATSENWESEFLQMGAYVVLTIFLFQKGSSESKIPHEENPEDEDPRDHRHKKNVPWPVRRGGWMLRIYENSLALAFLLLFAFSMVVHAWSGARLYSEEQIAAGESPVTFLEYLATPRFWFESFQNWQSEFLAIASMVLLSVFLRQRGSPESKPVASPHFATADEE